MDKSQETSETGEGQATDKDEARTREGAGEGAEAGEEWRMGRGKEGTRVVEEEGEGEVRLQPPPLSLWPP